MATKDQKPQLVFMPHYIGSLKYFERLIPFLEIKYEILFFPILPIPCVDTRFYKEMVQYCDSNNIRILKRSEFKPSFFLGYIPGYTLFKQAQLFEKDLKAFFENKNIRKIIAVNDTGFPLDYFFLRARKKGIDTMVLQWALVSPGQNNALHKPSFYVRTLVYRLKKAISIFLKRKLLEIIMHEKLDIIKHFIGNGSAERFGVINKKNFDYLKSRGIPEEKMSIVGYLDFYTAERVKKELSANAILKKEIAQKYSINTNKKNIILFTSPYNTKEVVIFDDCAQCAYVKYILDTVRNIFPSDDFDFLVKIHPAENINTYKPLLQEGIKIHTTSDNSELIYLSDLYLAESTTVNFIPVIMNKDCIFTNFLSLSLVELTKESFAIKKFITDKEEFKKLLVLFKDGNLPRQYVSDNDIFTTDSLAKILEWIG
jgi:hypothetical protein